MPSDRYCPLDAIVGAGITPVLDRDFSCIELHRDRADGKLLVVIPIQALRRIIAQVDADKEARNGNADTSHPHTGV
jgi:hypothetical protein